MKYCSLNVSVQWQELCSLSLSASQKDITLLAQSLSYTIGGFPALPLAETTACRSFLLIGNRYSSCGSLSFQLLQLNPVVTVWVTPFLYPYSISWYILPVIVVPAVGRVADAVLEF